MSEYDPIPLIIERVADPVELDSVFSRQGRGVNLGPHEAALRLLLREAHKVYCDALEDWKTRRDPNKPKKRLEANWSEDEQPHDYGADAGVGLEDWGKHWEYFYHRGPGGSGVGRTKDLPVAPLHPVYTLVRRWWLDTVGTEFRPKYPRAKVDEDGNRHGPRSNFALYTPAGRLLLMVAQEINPRYTPYICGGLYETRKKRRRRRRS